MKQATKHEKTNVLDSGYVQLVETWGSDERVIESARMSTAKGFLGWDSVCKRCHISTADNESHVPDGVPCYVNDGQHDWGPGDEKLLKYLWDHQHSTPFEMAGLTIEVKAPIFVFREWLRHRVPFGYNEMCLAGDTEITCIGSGGLTKHYTIEHLYNMKHVGIQDTMGRTRVLPSCRQRTLRVLDETTEQYVTAEMADVWQSGIQEVWRVETEKGHVVVASAKHPFYTREGWKKLGDLRPGDRLAANGLVAAMERPYPPALRAGIGVWTSMMRSRVIADIDSCYICGTCLPFNELELDHVVAVVDDLKRALDVDNLKPICEACHKQKSAKEQRHPEGQTRLGLRWVDLKKRPIRIGEQMTYDIEVQGAHKNFVANGLVVHNSARYVQLPNENYHPTLDRAIQTSKANKQAGTLDGAPELTPDAYHAWMEKVIAAYIACEDAYQFGLTNGVTKELARITVTVGRYSAMRATGNLRGWLGFLKLRCAPNAQWEIRQFANVVAGLVQKNFPRTYEVSKASVGMP